MRGGFTGGGRGGRGGSPRTPRGGGGPGRGVSRGGSGGGRGRGGPPRGRGGNARGGGRGGRGGLKAGAKVVVVPHRFEGVFYVTGKADALVTRNMVPGVSVSGEKRIEVSISANPGGPSAPAASDVMSVLSKVEYRVWNPFRSKLGAGIMGGIREMPIGPGSRVLYLGAANGTTVSYVSDIVGATGVVYAVEFSLRSGRDLLSMCKLRSNIVPILEDARMPWRYRMLVGEVDVVFADVAQPDQSRIISLNSNYFLKNNGHFILAIKASCIDSTLSPEVIFAREIDILKKFKLKPNEQLTLEPYHRDHSLIIGQYKPLKKSKTTSE